METSMKQQLKAVAYLCKSKPKNFRCFQRHGTVILEEWKTTYGSYPYSEWDQSMKFNLYTGEVSGKLW